MAAVSSAPEPKWVIDLHGMKEALTTRVNSARVAVIEAIQNGEMLILKSVSKDLKSLYPHLWDDFKAIAPKKYLATTVATIGVATQLMESYGSSLIGSIPTFEHFEALASARLKKCKLVSAGKALSHCNGISKKCGLPTGNVIGITGV